MNNKKNKKWFIIVILIFLFIYVICSFLLKNDGMNNSGIINTYYRVYTKENGWSKWSKNGLTAGNKENKVLRLEIKNIKKQPVTIFTYDNDWDSSETVSNKKQIYAINLANMYEITKNYQMCIRTYNKKDKWLNWTCDSAFVSGNSKEPVTAVQIKTIPNNVVKEEYLKDYIENKNSSSIGF